MAVTGQSSMWRDDSDEDGVAPDERERLTSLVASNRGLQQTDNALILFDEADDVLNSSFGIFSFLLNDNKQSPIKPWLTRMLESNDVPVFWIVNEYDGIDPAIQRRFSYALRFHPPAKATRIQMWTQVLQQKRIKKQLSLTNIERLAGDYKISVGMMEKAVETALLMSTDNKLEVPNLKHALDQSLELKHGRRQAGFAWPAPLAFAWM